MKTKIQSMLTKFIAAALAAFVLVPAATHTYPTSAASAPASGDVNGDGAVDAVDAVMLLKHIAGWNLENFHADAADTDGDGSITAIDAVRILKYLAGWDIKLGVSSEKQLLLDVLDLVNEARAEAGAGPLTLDDSLCSLAYLKAKDMCDLKYFDHTSPTYGTPFEMMKANGITYKSAGENIAYGYRTAEAVMNAWMNSEGHRKNILNESFTKIGIGYYPDGNYWVQMFIG